MLSFPVSADYWLLLTSQLSFTQKIVRYLIHSELSRSSIQIWENVIYLLLITWVYTISPPPYVKRYSLFSM